MAAGYYLTLCPGCCGAAVLAFAAPCERSETPKILPSTISQPPTSGTICLFILVRPQRCRLRISQRILSLWKPTFPCVAAYNVRLLSFTSRFPVMSHLSRLEIIRANPTGKGLDVFRKSFSSISKELSLPTSPEVLDQIGNEGKIYEAAIVFY